MTSQQIKEMPLALNHIMGFKEDKNPKKAVWKLLKHLAMFSRKERPLKGVGWLTNKMYKFSKTDFKQ